MICEQCKSHIQRQFSAFQGNTVNCLSYGCDNTKVRGYDCTRDELVKYAFEVSEKHYDDYIDHHYRYL